MRFRTRAIHVGQDMDPTTGATIPPVHLSTTFTHEALGEHLGYEYSRTGNPTRAALEALIASLEGARHGLAFASGMAASHAVLSLLDPGDHLVLSRDVYGGTFRLVDRFLATKGIDYSLADASDPAAVRAALTPATRMLFVETPSNPLLKISDLRALADELAGRGILMVVDNTFATPYLQRPLRLGADIVVHSSTKYLGGHSDVVGGLVAVNSAALAKQLKFVQNAVGAVPSPLDCYLTIRGIKTLPLRMEAHQANALRVAEFLQAHPKVGEVFYPGLPCHPGYEVAARQMTGYSGMLSFRLRGGPDAARRFVERLEVFSLAESLGGVESLVSLPALMTHAAFGAKLQRELGVTKDLVRLSIGVEDPDDLLADIAQALETA